MRASEYVTSGFLGICFLLSWIAFFQVAGGAGAHIPVANSFVSGKLDVAWALRIDTLTAVMLVVVTIVSFDRARLLDRLHGRRPCRSALLRLSDLLHLRHAGAGDRRQLRPDVLRLGRASGLASYLLIGFWYERPSANAAAIKAFVVNRVGDFGFSLGIFMTFTLIGSSRSTQVFAAARASPARHCISSASTGRAHDRLPAALLGAMGKSAQFPLHIWLPDAMEGPTPVSALIHAATMVTAGVYMVARLSPLFELRAGGAERGR